MRRERRPLDTPERRAVVHTSEDVLELKRLARQYRVSCRRVRRVGEVRFQLGLRGGDRVSLGAHGTVTFTDEGRTSHAHLFGIDYDADQLVNGFESILEFGAIADSPAELVLEAMPVAETPITGLIPVIGAATGSIVIEVKQPDMGPVVEGSAIATPVTSLTTRSIPVQLIVSHQLPAERPTLAQRQAEVVASLPTALRVWRRFVIGMILAVAAPVSLGAATVTGTLVPPIFVGFGAVAFLAGLIVTAGAVRTNDYRIDRLRAVGIR